MGDGGRDGIYECTLGGCELTKCDTQVNGGEKEKGGDDGRDGIYGCML